MTFYRVKQEYNNKPMLVKKRGNAEYWSVYVGGELFTPNEVAKRGLNMDYLETVDVNLRKTHKMFDCRVPNDDASITPVKMNNTAKKPRQLPAEIEEQLVRVANSRPISVGKGEGHKTGRGQIKIIRA